MNLLGILLQAQAEKSVMADWLPIILIIAAAFIFMIRPQMKKAKEQKKFKENLQKGDKVVTIGGIHGKIADMKETTVIIEVEGGNKLKMEKSAISPEFSATLNTNSDSK